VRVHQSQSLRVLGCGAAVQPIAELMECDDKLHRFMELLYRWVLLRGSQIRHRPGVSHHRLHSDELQHLLHHQLRSSVSGLPRRIRYGKQGHQFNSKPCTPYTTRSGISTSFCFNPATDPPPAESDQQCGDHWISGIYLTNQWTLYLVPFNSMLQQGFGKKQAKMDLHAVTMVRLTWDGGYIDYWIGKVAFYKHKSH